LRSRARRPARNPPSATKTSTGTASTSRYQGFSAGATGAARCPGTLAFDGSGGPETAGVDGVGVGVASRLITSRRDADVGPSSVPDTGSNGTQPQPVKYTSGQAVASAARTTATPSGPGGTGWNPTTTRVGSPTALASTA
jgi:hypothetical protein